MPEESAEEDTEMTNDATDTAEAPDAITEDAAASDAITEDAAASDATAETAVASDETAAAAPDETAETPAASDETAETPVAGTKLVNEWTGGTVAAPAEVIDEDALLAADDAEPEEPYVSPFDRPGKWFVVHTQSGYEKKVKRNIEARTESMNMEHRIYEVQIPTREVTELKNLKKVVTEKKLFPGYLLVRCRLDDDAWYVLRNTPGVTGFVNQGGKPSPLRRKDVETFLGIEADRQRAAAKKSKPMFEYGMGETIRVVEGPFADFLGEIIEINEDQLKVKVLLNIFGRETPVELEFAQVARL